MCDNANYREGRWFSGWKKRKQTEEYYLPRMIQEITGQVKLADVVVGLIIGSYILLQFWL